MRPILLNHCLAKSQTLEKVRNFFEDVCNLKLQVLDSDGFVVMCAEQQTPIPPKGFSSPLLNPNLKTAGNDGVLSVSVPADVIEQCSRVQKPVHYLCSKGYRNFLVPIIKRENVVGFLTTGEKEGVVLGERQIKSMVVFLQDVLKKSLEEDLDVYKDFGGQSFSPQMRVLNKVLKYITQRYDVPSLTLREIARENGVSYFHLSHLFKKELKTTFSDYLNNLRISVAVRLLKDKSLTVNQVSSLCGYEDPSYFGKVFKKIQGISPAAFRNQSVVEIPVIPDYVPDFILQD